MDCKLSMVWYGTIIPVPVYEAGIIYLLLVPWFTTPVGSGIIPVYHGTKVLQRDYQLQSYGTLLTVQILCIPSWYNISIQPLGIRYYTVVQDHFPHINPTISNWYRTNLNLKILTSSSYDTSSSCDSNPSETPNLILFFRMILSLYCTVK